MSTKIQLEPPYNNIWKAGYVVTNSEKRKTVVLYNSSKDRSSVSYARYVMAVSLGRLLLPDEHVDHIDNDKTNDVLSNLQILSPIENNRKSTKPRKVYVFSCPICGEKFTLAANRAYGKVNPACSRACGYEKTRAKLLKPYSGL